MRVLQVLQHPPLFLGSLLFSNWGRSMPLPMAADRKAWLLLPAQRFRSCHTSEGASYSFQLLPSRLSSSHLTSCARHAPG